MRTDKVLGLFTILTVVCTSVVAQDKTAHDPGTICPEIYIGQMDGMYCYLGQEQGVCDGTYYLVHTSQNYSVSSCSSCADPITGVAFATDIGNPAMKKGANVARSHLTIEMTKKLKASSGLKRFCAPRFGPPGRSKDPKRSFLISDTRASVIVDEVGYYKNSANKAFVFRLLVVRLEYMSNGKRQIRYHGIGRQLNLPHKDADNGSRIRLKRILTEAKGPAAGHLHIMEADEAGVPFKHFYVVSRDVINS